MHVAPQHLLPLILLPLLGCTPTPSAAPPPAALAPTVLHSPWDATPINLTPEPYTCGPPIPIAPDITITTSQKNLSPDVKQAIYPESDASLHDLTRRTVAAADTYRRNGSKEAAQCVISLLADDAAHHAMAGYMADADAWQEQNMTLRSISIAYLKVRDSGLATTEQNALISDWMNHIVRAERSYYEGAHCGPNGCALRGHRGLGVAMAAAAIGVIAQDHSLFQWAVHQYQFAVDNIDDRGMLHYDLSHQYALKFHIVSAAELVQIAEFAEANGDPLYDYDNGRIHLLVRTVTRALVDSGPFDTATGSTQRLQKPLEPWEITWASVYNRRFPDPLINSLLQQIGPAGADMWGGQPWDGETGI